MVTTKKPTATKQRTMRVLSHWWDMLIVRIRVEGKDTTYFVRTGRHAFGTSVIWTHVENSEKSYNVEIDEHGHIWFCKCPATVDCRHRAATAKLIELGRIKPVIY